MGSDRSRLLLEQYVTCRAGKRIRQRRQRRRERQVGVDRVASTANGNEPCSLRAVPDERPVAITGPGHRSIDRTMKARAGSLGTRTSMPSVPMLTGISAMAQQDREQPQ